MQSSKEKPIAKGQIIIYKTHIQHRKLQTHGIQDKNAKLQKKMTKLKNIPNNSHNFDVIAHLKE